MVGKRPKGRKIAVFAATLACCPTRQKVPDSFALHSHAHQLPLRLANLVVQSAQRPQPRARMIILHEVHRNARADEQVLSITFEEKPALIFKYLWLN